MKRKSLSNGLVLDRAKVRLPMRVLIDIRATVQGSPFRLFLEKAHSLDVLRTKQSASSHSKGGLDKLMETDILVIGGETMVDTSGKDDQVILRQLDPNPFVLLTTHVKVTLAITDVADLLVFVQMLIEEHLHFLLVHITHRLWRNYNLITILVPTFLGQFINRLEGGEMVVLDSNGGEIVHRHRAAGVMGFPLVTLL